MGGSPPRSAAAAAAANAAAKPPFELWRPPRARRALRSFLLSFNYLRLALQLAVGGVLVSLFTFLE